jgi:hypothetical protein
LSKRSNSPSDLKAQLREIERQISDVVDTIVAVGKSDALTQRLKQLESQRKTLMRRAEPAVSTMIPRFADRWSEIVSNLERLPARAKPRELQVGSRPAHDVHKRLAAVERFTPY